jgi:bacteriocin-like protein
VQVLSPVSVKKNIKSREGMKMMNKNEVNNEERILSRQLAEELSIDELDNISGGTTSYCGCNCTPDDCDWDTAVV